MELIISIIIGYLIGSLPFALIIGKFFYKTDVRNYGSGNLGGSNTGRVLGKKAGFAVMVLDVAKVIAVFLINDYFHFNITSIIWSGLLAAIGHCYPLFASFKGGKAVSTMYGFLFGCMIYVFNDPLIFFLPLTIFLIILYLSKIVAISSILSAIASTIQIFIISGDLTVSIASLLITLLLIYKHKSNIKRMIDGNENKINWM